MSCEHSYALKYLYLDRNKFGRCLKKSYLSGRCYLPRSKLPTFTVSKATSDLNCGVPVSTVRTLTGYIEPYGTSSQFLQSGSVLDPDSVRSVDPDPGGQNDPQK